MAAAIPEASVAVSEGEIGPMVADQVTPTPGTGMPRRSVTCTRKGSGREEVRS